MFFDKKWSDVTDEDITSLSEKLSTQMGGWIFHQKVDFTKPTPHLTLNQGQPALMKKEND